MKAIYYPVDRWRNIKIQSLQDSISTAGPKSVKILPQDQIDAVSTFKASSQK